MKKRLLITGGNGFIGSNLAEFYKDKYTVRAIGRESLFKTFADFTPHIIIHTTAEIYDEDLMFDTNVAYTRDILNYCKNFNVEKLILFGSSSEYGRKNEPISEETIPDPESMYEVTKFFASKLAKEYSDNFNKNITLIRPFTVVGRGEKPHKFFPTLYKKYKNDETLKLAEGNHDFVFIDEFLLAFDAILNKDINGFDLINVGSGAQHSNAEIVKAFETALNYKYKIEYVDKMREQDSPTWVADPTKLLTKYGVNVKIDVVEGVRKFISDCRELNLYNE